MNDIKIKLCEISTKVLPIGFEGEQNSRRVIFDASEQFTEYPSASASLTVKPPVGNIYPKATTRDGNNIIWEIAASDCANDGDGEYQLTFTQGEAVRKTWNGFTKVYKSLVGNGSAPTPVEDWIEDAQAALNALEYLSASASSLPYGSSATAEMTDVDGHKNIAIGVPAGAPGQDGVSPSITITDITGGHRVSVTDANGTHTFDVMNGTDGVSPVVTVTNITGGHQVTITDATGNHTFNVMDGQDADPSLYVLKADFYASEMPMSALDSTKVATEIENVKSAINSIEDSIAPVESSATATSAHAVGELFILDDSLLVALSAIAVGDTITTTGNSPNAAVTKLSDKLIKDVQVNGTSVVTNGVANVPQAGTTTSGTVKVQSAYGIQLYQGILSIYAAETAQAKAGDSYLRPLTPRNQHESAFYGFAKAAGDTTQKSSNNAVGTYTEDAKSKISDMLTAPVTVSGSTPSITAKSGITYKCGEVSTLSVTLPASGDVEVIFSSGSTATVLTLTPPSGVTAIKWAGSFDPTSLDADTVYDMIITDGEYGMVASWV